MASANGVFEIVPGKNEQGDAIFAVVVKRTYRIKHGSVAERCAADRELRQIDAYYDNGDPEWATVQYESELAPYKPAVDVVVIGKAYAPGGVPTAHASTLSRPHEPRAGRGAPGSDSAHSAHRGPGQLNGRGDGPEWGYQEVRAEVATLCAG